MRSAMKTALLLCLLLSAICWIFFAKTVSAGSLIVVPDDYSTIQAAINNALDGGSILVKPGTYIERLKISKSINLTGSGALSTFIESPGGGHTVEISFAANVVFTGFTLRGTGASLGSGIYVRSSLNDTIRDNVVINHEYGIHIYDSSGNTLKNNNMSNNKYNLRVWGLFLSHFLHDIDSSNLVNEKPVYYWVNQHDRTVPQDAGYVALVNSVNIVVKDLNISNNLAGVLLAYSSNNIITGVTSFNNERGLYLISSHSNKLVGNNIFNISWIGISTVSSRSNLMLGNTVRKAVSGIRLSHSFNLLGYYSENNVIVGNVIENNIDGIYLETSDNNNVRGNKVTNNTSHGMVIDGSSKNVIWKNILANNKHGIRIYALERAASDNIFYHNNIVNNTNSVIINSTFSSANKWRIDYPVGGNFWGFNVGADEFSGPHQNESGGDGIVDVPYAIDENNIDQYPLAIPSRRNEPPTAQFSYYPQSPKWGDTVTFVNDAFDKDGEIILGIWRLGNSLYLGMSFSFNVDEVKSYVASLTVFDNEGATSTITHEITVQKAVPSLYFSIPSKAIAGTPINLTAVLWNTEKAVPITNALVYFYLNDTRTRIQIGFSTTNTVGTATILYIHPKAGTFRVSAVFEGNQIYNGVNSVQDLIVNESRSYWLECVILVFVSVTLAISLLTWRTLRNRRK